MGRATQQARATGSAWATGNGAGGAAATGEGGTAAGGTAGGGTAAAASASAIRAELTPWRVAVAMARRSRVGSVAQREVAAAIEGSTQLPSNDDQLMYHFRELAFQFRGHCGQITNELAEPVPFPYFHMLTFLLFADLLAISWALVTLRIHPALTVTVYVVVLLLFAGLRQVAVDMSNPFGEDEIDVRCPPRTRVGLPATHAASLLTSNVRARVRVPPRSSTSRRSSRRRLITRRLPLPTTGSRTAAPLRL